MILLAGRIEYAHEELQLLRDDGHRIVQLDCTSREEFFAKLSGEYSGVRAIYRHNDSAAQIGSFDAALIERLPLSCGCICHNGAGYDQIDVAAAKARGMCIRCVRVHPKLDTLLSWHDMQEFRCRTRQALLTMLPLPQRCFC